MTSSILLDVIDQLAGIQPGDSLDAIRAHRSQARQHAQQSFLALFEPAQPLPGDEPAFSSQERFAVATFVAGLHGQPEVAAFYAAGLSRHGAPTGLLEALVAEAAGNVRRGPYGSYPPGPLSVEDVPGPFHAVSEARRAVFGDRLSAALAHAHLLVLHPRDARAKELQALLDAGWSTTGIVSLSQLVAFLSFQIRVVVGLRTLAARPASSTAA
jgi:CMD domain protein